MTLSKDTEGKKANKNKVIGFYLLCVKNSQIPMNPIRGKKHAHLLFSRSQMESGLHGVGSSGGSGLLVGIAGGVGQLGW